MTMDMKMTFSGFVLVVLVTTVVGSSVRRGEVSDNLIHCKLPEFRECLLYCWSIELPVDCFATCTYVIGDIFGAQTDSSDCTIFKTCYFLCMEDGKSEDHCWEVTTNTVTGAVGDLYTC
uniref:Conotoxin n=1 Tax=Conus praecellens TaxID=128530 RepID=A0A291C299_CONPC|nr:conotoxin [Conus praecellens]